MKKTIPFLLATAVLTACGPTDTENKDVPTVEALASDSARLKELRQQCKTDRATLGDVLCNRVAEATRKRFYGDGKTPYTPPKEPPKF
ncbi:entry exclusion lipoprotein TrbK [Pseudomonas chlororaphis]|uniref:entry exclusion lipoprotein TrbK n=1 Tax=Pseudomonas chlororaphis TaxID=587753 RepID=UPI001B31F49D|nr:entry exclusion lipoprotein TrbK [Pseudomonas chlororaphis]MBP5053915.1 entry exclusion lipoprotein TrbK [Pseudomonas chlororaphis]MBP5143123.1 entry exclusion lipoprotein TrbK [Pseudomonas chlororaphis]